MLEVMQECDGCGWRDTPQKLTWWKAGYDAWSGIWCVVCWENMPAEEDQKLADGKHEQPAEENNIIQLADDDDASPSNKRARDDRRLQDTTTPAVRSE